MDRFVDEPWERRAMNDKVSFQKRPILHGVNGERETGQWREAQCLISLEVGRYRLRCVRNEYMNE